MNQDIGHRFVFRIEKWLWRIHGPTLSRQGRFRNQDHLIQSRYPNVCAIPFAGVQGTGQYRQARRRRRAGKAKMRETDVEDRERTLYPGRQRCREFAALSATADAWREIHLRTT